jgi:hypothetical protein
VTPDGRREPGSAFLDGAANPERRWGLSPFDSHAVELLPRDEALLRLTNRLDEDDEEQLTEDPDALIDLEVPSGYEEFADRDTRDRARERWKTRSPAGVARGSRTKV